MFLEVITLLMLFTFIVSQLLLTRFISKNLKKDRELSRVREDRLLQVSKRVEATTQLVEKTQIDLDVKMDALSVWMDKRNTYVVFQQEQFKSLAKTDMLAARRDELIRTKELKVALERIISMTTMSRQDPSAIDQLAIESLTNRIEELEVILENGNTLNESKVV